jgi:hypothetical protein
VIARWASPLLFLALSRSRGPEIAVVTSERDGSTFLGLGDVSGAVDLPGAGPHRRSTRPSCRPDSAYGASMVSVTVTYFPGSTMTV